MSLLKLGACMLADAVLTVASCGFYAATRDGYDNTSFTEDELRYQRQKENFKTAADAYAKLVKSKERQ